MGLREESSEFHRQARVLAMHWPDVFVRDVAMPGKNHFSVCSALADSSGALFAAARELTER